MNPVYNPQIVKWENHKEGVHYYKRGILERVEGRRLVYKFSMLALEKLQSPRKDSGQ
ncbi:hypothetical protein ACJMK2_020938 [Sinanodonta woodiana]|uniref:ETS domain-containing protein n=1 Tax=Sinanodonta woodiana TaxID=1069815 RepID=A0ABD3U397_SINWO